MTKQEILKKLISHYENCIKEIYNDEGEKGIESFIESRGDSYEGIVPHISDQPKKYNVNGSTYIVAKMP